jgi:hypothetical protein
LRLDDKLEQLARQLKEFGKVEPLDLPALPTRSRDLN